MFTFEHVLGYGRGHYSHAVCQALKLPVTCRLTSQRPEEQRNTHAHTLPHMRSYSLMLSRRCPLFSPSYISWHPPTHTHTHYNASHVSLSSAYQSFYFNFPFPTLRQQPVPSAFFALFLTLNCFMSVWRQKYSVRNRHEQCAGQTHKWKHACWPQGLVEL